MTSRETGSHRSRYISKLNAYYPHSSGSVQSVLTSSDMSKFSLLFCLFLLQSTANSAPLSQNGELIDIIIIVCLNNRFLLDISDYGNYDENVEDDFVEKVIFPTSMINSCIILFSGFMHNPCPNWCTSFYFLLSSSQLSRRSLSRYQSIDFRSNHWPSGSDLCWSEWKSKNYHWEGTSVPKKKMC